MTSPLQLRLHGLLVLCLAALVLTACGSGENNGPGRADPTSAPPTDTIVRTLPAGELAVESSSQRTKIGYADPGKLPVVGYSRDWVFSVTEPDDVLHVIDRATGKQAWTAAVPKVHGSGKHGVCRPPELASEHVLAVFVGYHCEQLYTYDVDTGRQLARTTMTKNFQDEIGEVHITTAGGTIWWATEGGRVGYIDEDGSVVGVLTSADVGVDDNTLFGGLDTVPGEDRLILNVFHDDHPMWDEWIGIDVDASVSPATAQVRWRFSDRATQRDLRTLALPDYARGTTITMREDGPGGLVLAGAKGGRIAVGQPDAETGHVEHPAHVPLEPRPTVADTDFAAQPEYVVTDDTLYTTVQPRAGHRAYLDAFDLATGRQLWKREVPTPSDDGNYYYVQSVQVAEDGSLYVESTEDYEDANLLRIDPATGEAVQTWALPLELGDGYQFQVIGDHVYATVDDTMLERRPATVVLEVQPSGTAARGVAPAKGPLLDSPHLSLHLADHVKWNKTRPFAQGPIRSVGAAGSSDAFVYATADVMTLSTGPISGDVRADAVHSARLVGRAIGLRADRTINGVRMVVVAASKLKDDTKNVELFYAAERDGAYVEVSFEVPDERPPSMELIESMLKSIKWK